MNIDDANEFLFGEGLDCPVCHGAVEINYTTSIGSQHVAMCAACSGTGKQAAPRGIQALATILQTTPLPASTSDTTTSLGQALAHAVIDQNSDPEFVKSLAKLYLSISK